MQSQYGGAVQSILSKVQFRGAVSMPFSDTDFLAVFRLGKWVGNLARERYTEEVSREAQDIVRENLDFSLNGNNSGVETLCTLLEIENFPILCEMQPRNDLLNINNYFLPGSTEYYTVRCISEADRFGEVFPLVLAYQEYYLPLITGLERVTKNGGFHEISDQEVASVFVGRHKTMKEYSGMKRRLYEQRRKVNEIFNFFNEQSGEEIRNDARIQDSLSKILPVTSKALFGHLLK